MEYRNQRRKLAGIWSSSESIRSFLTFLPFHIPEVSCFSSLGLTIKQIRYSGLLAKNSSGEYKYVTRAMETSPRGVKPHKSYFTH